MLRLANVALRPETEADRTFLLELFVAIREGEPGFRELIPAERTRLLHQQFEWQRADYRARFPSAWFTVVTVDQRPVGRLCVNSTPDELRVVDLALLPEFHGHGIGSQLIRNLQAEATRTRQPLRLQVFTDSPARGFYARLGFRECGSRGLRTQLEWYPPQSHP